MPRDISAGMLASLTANQVYPAFLAELTFKSETVYVWSGYGNIVYGGNTYTGLGDLGKIGKLAECTATRAEGTTVALSGINPAILNECLTDIQLGAPAILYFALMDGNGNILGTPFPVFSGTVDKPTITPGIDTIEISLALETKMANHARPSARRYTSADQQIQYPGDTAFNWVETLNDQALRWTP